MFEMCPPIPSLDLIGPHHHSQGIPRTRLLIRRSISWLPGKWRLLAGCKSCSGRGVVAVKGRLTPAARRACSESCCSKRPARSGPPWDKDIIQRIQPLPGSNNSTPWSFASQPRLVFSINECGTFHDSPIARIFCWTHGSWRKISYNFGRPGQFGKLYNGDSLRSLGQILSAT